MARMEYTLEGEVALVTMNEGENRLNIPFLNDFMAVLDEIEQQAQVHALVVTSAHDKIFCNGLDLDWLGPLIREGNRESVTGFCYLLNGFLRRILLYPMPTIAAISGHAFAAGAIMTCCFDFRFMRADRGYFCFPEVDLGIPFWPGMVAMVRRAIPQYMLDELYYTGARLTGSDCAAHNIVRSALPREDLLPKSLAFAAGLKKQRGSYRALKERMNADIIRIMDEEDPPLLDTGVITVGQI